VLADALAAAFLADVARATVLADGRTLAVLAMRTVPVVLADALAAAGLAIIAALSVLAVVTSTALSALVSPAAVRTGHEYKRKQLWTMIPADAPQARNKKRPNYACKRDDHDTATGSAHTGVAVRCGVRFLSPQSPTGTV
jgi:hypothetical protein